MARIFRYLTPFWPKMLFGFVIKFFGTIMDLLLPWILSYIIDEIVPRGSAQQIWLAGSIMVLCALIAWLTNITANRMASAVARDSIARIRHDLFVHTMALSTAQVDSIGISSLQSRLTTDTYHLHRMISMMQRLGIRAPILLIGGIIVTMTLEPRLSLVLIALLPCICFLVWRVSRRGLPLFSAVQRAVDNMVCTVRDNISGVRIIKALSKTDDEKLRFAQACQSLSSSETLASSTMALTNPMMKFFLNCGRTMVIFVGAYCVNRGIMNPGKLIAFLSYFVIILNAMLSITKIFTVYSRGCASAIRIAEILQAPEQLAVQDLARAESAPYLEFSHVSFAYGRQNVLHDISFSLARGQTLGIIGATGSGKSTIVALLLRLYDAASGNIFIDGVDIRSLPPKTLYQTFGTVRQHDKLLGETVCDNIRFGRDIPFSSVETAARCACASAFISELPKQYDTQLSQNGANLSGGQRQRILISRALAANPEILILDDATSALDYRTDLQFRRNLKSFYPGITSIIVAQRINSIRFADKILVLDKGHIIGFGSHEDLMQNCDVYLDIYQSQIGGGGNGSS